MLGRNLDVLSWLKRFYVTEKIELQARYFNTNSVQTHRVYIYNSIRSISWRYSYTKI